MGLIYSTSWPRAILVRDLGREVNHIRKNQIASIIAFSGGSGKKLDFIGLLWVFTTGDSGPSFTVIVVSPDFAIVKRR